nr:MAG TPA: hypothetical protein [Caudoviricetes sp.]
MLTNSWGFVIIISRTVVLVPAAYFSSVGTELTLRPKA